jgi:hypothetical protein
MVIHAVYENGVFRPTEAVELPENCRVTIVVDNEPLANSPASCDAPLASLAALAAAHPENPDLPADFSEQHDHFLYGTPKR